MKFCKLCPTTAIVGVLGLAGLGIAGYTTVTGKSVFGGECALSGKASEAAISTVAGTGDSPCCSADKVVVETVAQTEEGCCEVTCDEAKEACCDGEATQVASTDSLTVIPVAAPATSECTEMTECTEAKASCTEKTECTEKTDCSEKAEACTGETVCPTQTAEKPADGSNG